MENLDLHASLMAQHSVLQFSYYENLVLRMLVVELRIGQCYDLPCSGLTVF
jgi:hypothetical protein